jgi:hypothetical protein
MNLKTRIEIMKEDVRDYVIGERMEGKKPTIWGFIRWGYIEPVLFYIQVKLCQYRGHKYRNSGGYANGDSGADYFTCKRCGHEFSHIYY